MEVNLSELNTGRLPTGQPTAVKLLRGRCTDEDEIWREKVEKPVCLLDVNT